MEEASGWVAEEDTDLVAAAADMAAVVAVAVAVGGMAAAKAVVPKAAGWHK